MTDDLMMAHRHVDTEVPMRATDEDHIDGLRVREFACSCGFGAAVLFRVDDEEQGPTWPYTLKTTPLA